MNKADLTERLAAGADIPKVRAANYINIMVKAIQEALVTGEKVTISDFGTFTISQRREVGSQPQERFRDSSTCPPHSCIPSR